MSKSKNKPAFIFFDPDGNTDLFGDEEESGKTIEFTDDSQQDFLDTVIQAGYDLKKNGYSFVNSNEGFSYPRGYRIPIDRFKEVFGSQWSELLLRMIHISTYWGGSCFGMSATSILAYQKRLFLGKYQAKDSSVTSTAYDRIVTGTASGNYFCLEKNSPLTEIIERYQIYQHSDEYTAIRTKDIIDHMKEDEKTRMQRFLSNIRIYHIPYVVGIIWTERYDGKDYYVGHALVVDSGRDPAAMPGGWFKVYLYDPNNPYKADMKGTAAYYYAQAENRFILVNPNTGEWKMSALVNQNGSTATEVGSHKANSRFFFVNAENLPADTHVKASLYSAGAGKLRLYYSGSSVTCMDLDGRVLYEVKNGLTVQSADPKIAHLPMLNGFTDEPGGFILLPYGYANVRSEGGSLVVFGQDEICGAAADGEFTLSWSEDDGMTIRNPGKLRCEAGIQKKDGGEQFSFITAFDLDAGSSSRFRMDDETIRIESDSRQSANVRFFRGDREFGYNDIRIDSETVIRIGKDGTDSGSRSGIRSK